MSADYRLLLAIVIALFVGGPFVAGANSHVADHASPVASPAVDCPVTEPNESLSVTGKLDPQGYGNDALSTSLWKGGEVVFEPGGPGFVLPKGGLGMKWGWVPYVSGELVISGRRLDADAPPLRAKVGEGWVGDKMFFPSYVVFSTPGCWEVTGEIDGQRLTFVTLVILKGDGPDRRLDTIP